ncbi:isoprenoid synthase domain-containing protein [Hygrophoropsis aurantiaca]|uniref:Isoprenoid synthase domain-containing protein n=1 Tax=Hygrophoropsis aurantiaca TaxID=72124 RepID=A0ACB7ZZ19_9AGAM|nr:isoprenoid synthase domain-containing protein [Hygrophoropsis aurantiaca]
MSTPVLHLPDLLALCPRETGNLISPHFQEADADYRTWVEKTLGGYFSESDIKEVSNAEIPLVAALAWPLANTKDLCAIVAYLTLSWMLEEMTDRTSSTESEKNSKLWLTVLENPEAGKESRHPMIQIMRNGMVASLKDAVDPYHWPDFLAVNTEFAKSISGEAHDRELSKDPNATRSIDSYMMTRRETIGVRPCFVLIQSTRRLYLPDRILKHPIIEEMVNAILDTSYIANDIYSFKKEMVQNGALINIITVIHRDPGTKHLDLQGRIDYAGKLFETAIGRFQKCREMLPSFDDPDIDRQVSEYADGLLDWTVGNIQWSLVNHRYNVFNDDEDRQKNIMRLD